MPAPAFVVDASVVVRWLIDGPFNEACHRFLDRCGDLDARLLAPTCLYSEVSNALYRLCLAPVTPPPLVPIEAMNLVRSMPDLDIALVDHVRRLPSGEIGVIAYEIRDQVIPRKGATSIRLAHPGGVCH
jgi:hypothetical protein